MNNYLSIDLETFGKGSDSIVLSIGACLFNDIDPFTFNKLTTVNSVYYELNLLEQEKHNRSVSIDTITWWINENPLILKELLNKNKQKIAVFDALFDLNTFINKHNIQGIWSKGPSFDMTILCSLYDPYVNLKDSKIFDYRKWYDVRTIKLLLKSLNIPENKSKYITSQHSALYDAFNQAVLVNDAILTLKKL